MHHFLAELIYYANAVFIGYFVAANLCYTLLMVLSLYSVSLHSTYARLRTHADLADSPVTLPVSVIIAAYNEEEASCSPYCRCST